MNSSRTSTMRQQRKNPAVLRMALIKCKGHYSTIFIFEGIQDISVYENLIPKCGFNRDYGYIYGEGKEQLLKLHNQLIENEENNHLENTYFFVDQDFDLFTPISENIFTLDSYSIENKLMNNPSIESIFRDEIKLSTTHHEYKERYFNMLNEDYNKFTELVREICINLFISKTFSLDEPFPESIKSYIKIELGNISKITQYIPRNIDKITEIIAENHPIIKYYNELSNELAIRGKYIIEFIKEWINSLIINIKSDTALTGIASRIKASQDFVSMRRLAQGCPPDDNLAAFLAKIA